MASGYAVAKAWRNLKVPTLFLVGENEVTYSAQKAIRHLNRVAPKVKTVITPDAGHDLVIVKTEWVNNEVLKFLTNQEGQGASPVTASQLSR
jgi:pimeloyl-ACP methyl ester carboxylesterase